MGMSHLKITTIVYWYETSKYIRDKHFIKWLEISRMILLIHSIPGSVV